MTRKYTGFDQNATGRRAGTEKLVQLICFVAGNKLWNNGTWAVRNMNNANLAAPKPSVHGTGRAADLSWRKRNDGKGSGNYDDAKNILDFLVTHADRLLIEELHDYWPAPFGRGWKCDRGSWKVYDKPSIGSAPGGDWIHFEISNDHADDPGFYDQAFKEIFSGQAPVPAAPAKPVAVAPAATPQPAVSATTYPGKPLKKLSKGTAVKQLQERLGLVADGSFGPQTEKAVKDFQTANGLLADGVVGPKSWVILFPG